MGHLTRSMFQRETGKTRYEVEKLLAAGLPHTVVGSGRGSEIRIDRAKAMAWFAGIVLEAQSEPGSSPELTRERTRLAKEQADKTAMENAVSRGELLRAGEVRKTDEVIFIALRDRVMAVQSVAAVMSDLAVAGKPGEARALLRQALRDALEDVGSAELVALGSE